eukprot:163008-Chlamydomonas_euryale.AAC.1
MATSPGAIASDAQRSPPLPPPPPSPPYAELVASDARSARSCTALDHQNARPGTSPANAADCAPTNDNACAPNAPPAAGPRHSTVRAMRRAGACTPRSGTCGAGG